MGSQQSKIIWDNSRTASRNVNSLCPPPRLCAPYRAGGAVALAAIGWGIIEPLLPVELGRSGASPAGVDVIFTIGSIARVHFALVGRASDWLPICKVIYGGTVAMAFTSPPLSIF